MCRFPILITLIFAVIAFSNVRAEKYDYQFITSVERDLVPQEVLTEYEESIHVLRYQVVLIDADYLREIIREHSSLPEQDTGRMLRFSLFDDYQFEFYGKIVDEVYEGPGTGNARWGGISEGEMSGAALFVIGPNNRITGTVGTINGSFEIDSIDFPPYHILWQRDPSIEVRID